jgi:hypothetical protein
MNHANNYMQIIFVKTLIVLYIGTTITEQSYVLCVLARARVCVRECAYHS